MNKLPSIPLSQETANKLASLYDEMEFVDSNPEKSFHQAVCDRCVIGNAIRDNMIEGFKVRPDREVSRSMFLKAVRSLGIKHPFKSRGYSILDNAVQDYLFGGESSVNEAAQILRMPKFTGGYTAKNAMKRIEAVLHRAGYELALK